MAQIAPGIPSTTRPTKPPMFAWLELTGKCNLRCQHCYADSSPEVSHSVIMTEQRWQQAIDQLIEAGCEKVQFIGGEPFLVPYFASLLKYAVDSELKAVEVFTNLTHLRPKYVPLLQHPKISVATSFYSTDPAIHQAVTGFDSWQRTVDGIQTCIANNIPLRVGVIEMAENDGHYESSREFLGGLGVRDIGHDRIRSIGRPTKGCCKESDDFSQLCGACGDGSVAILPDGNVHPCVFSRKTVLGNITENNFRDIWSNNAIQEFREKMDEEMSRRIGVTSCIPGPCMPGNPCAPYECYPQNQPCQPMCSPMTCMPGSGPCYPAGS